MEEHGEESAHKLEMIERARRHLVDELQEDGSHQVGEGGIAAHQYAPQLHRYAHLYMCRQGHVFLYIIAKINL